MSHRCYRNQISSAIPRNPICRSPWKLSKPRKERQLHCTPCLLVLYLTLFREMLLYFSFFESPFFPTTNFPRSLDLRFLIGWATFTSQSIKNQFQVVDADTLQRSFSQQFSKGLRGSRGDQAIPKHFCTAGQEGYFLPSSTDVS